jgi:hypothetical protein
MKIEPLTDDERRIVRAELLTLISSCGRRVEEPLAGALLMARVEEAARELCGEFVRDARMQERLTWSVVGKAFGITMQSAQWRFIRPARRPATRMRR